jgi:hypothetical protein
MMLIPVFGSCPTDLNENQDAARRVILGELGRAGLEVRTVGKTDYPTSFPLREVVVLAKHCAGGLILGFSQFESKTGVWKRGTPSEREVGETTRFSTPWNQIEGGILFALGVPLLVFREQGISGGIFDNGVTDVFIHEMPIGKLSASKRKGLREIVRKWAAEVHTQYYGGR